MNTFCMRAVVCVHEALICVNSNLGYKEHCGIDFKLGRETHYPSNLSLLNTLNGDSIPHSAAENSQKDR